MPPMKFTLNKTLVALIGAVVFPLAALFYLSGLPDGGRGSLAAVLLQVSIVLGSIFLFAIFLGKLVEQMNGKRVRRWLESPEGQDWLSAMPEDERAEFLDRLEGKSPSSVAPLDEELPVDSSEPSR